MESETNRLCGCLFSRREVKRGYYRTGSLYSERHVTLIALNLFRRPDIPQTVNKTFLL